MVYDLVQLLYIHARIRKKYGHTFIVVIGDSDTSVEPSRVSNATF